MNELVRDRDNFPRAPDEETLRERARTEGYESLAQRFASPPLAPRRETSRGPHGSRTNERL